MGLSDDLRAMAARAAQAASACGISSPLREVAAQGNVLVIVEVRTIADPAPIRLSPCERDIMDFLRSIAPERRTGHEIREALEQANKLWGDSTIRACLANLKRAGLIENDHDGHGYGLFNLLASA